MNDLPNELANALANEATNTTYVPGPAKDLLALLREPATVRLRSAAITRAVSDGLSPFFRIDRSALPAAAARVAALTLSHYPDLKIPLHSRWRHFEAGGVDRKSQLDALLATLGRADVARAQIDLTVLSVLLDAGAGAKWRYVEHVGGANTPSAMALPADRLGSDDLLALLDSAASGKAKEAVVESDDGTAYTRSEGLAVASYQAFIGGVFSAKKDEPCRVDASALKTIDVAALRAVFQAGTRNPMVGLEGRAALLARLGAALLAEHAKDGMVPRPSGVVDRVTHSFTRNEVSATDLLQELLRCFGPIWQNGTTLKGVNAGDVWPHRWAGSATAKGDDVVTVGWVPFHKLSQWLVYSLVEPLTWAGVTVTGLDELTALPEYRNGGLLIDAGVLVPRRASYLERSWKPGDEIVIEWRALTITLMDELAALVRAELGSAAINLPLACVLQGGTWAAGRALAQELRGGAPPLNIESDGTIF